MKFNVKKSAAALAAAALGTVTLLQSTAALAAQTWFDDDEAMVRLRLKNDLRRADKPSAGNDNEISAWVQGMMAEVDTGWLNDFVGFDAGYYYVAKLHAPEDKTTRWYLDDHSSFGYWLAAAKFRYEDYVKLKVGRFVTDQSYGALPYYVPLINSNSNRTLPTASQGALLYLHPHQNLDLWCMWRDQVFTPTSALQGGMRKEGVYNSKTGDYDEEHPRSFFAFSVYNDAHRLSGGISYQDDVSTQVMVNLDNSWKLDSGNKVSTALRYFGAQTNGDGTQVFRDGGMADDTDLYTGKISYTTQYGTVYTAVEYMTHATNGSFIDSDVGFPNSFSMDRNHEGMFSIEVGYILPVTSELSLMLAPIYTNGYEDHSREVDIEGYGINYGVMYKAKSGPLEGLDIKLFGDWCMERRDGSQLGDRLHFWDVKLTVQYDIDFLK